MCQQFRTLSSVGSERTRHKDRRASASHPPKGKARRAGAKGRRDMKYRESVHDMKLKLDA